MNRIELEKLVREIVQEVLLRIENNYNLTTTLYGPQGKPRQYKNATSDRRISENGNKKLYVERDMFELAKQGIQELRIARQTIITPSARDAARDKGIRIIRE